MVTVSNLHFSYGPKNVFKGLDLTLEAGYIYGLLGKNGTGKSTLLHNIAGLLYPSKGTIDVLGFYPRRRNPEFLERIFMVPEEFHLPDTNLRQWVRYQSAFYPRFNKQQFAQYLTEFEISAGDSLRQMSYGQRKKVLISFCLATNAALMLMDEPTNGLDIISKSQFRKVLAGAVDENKIIIISTHQVKDLESLIDRVTILDDGQILFDQTIDAITRKLLFKISFNKEDVGEALYSESTLRGYTMVAPNTSTDEGKLDLELLYKAIITNSQKVQALFKD